MITSRIMLLFTALSGFIFVLLGALASHSLARVINSEAMSWLQTGLLYQIVHTLMIALLAILLLSKANRFFSISAVLFMIGIILFSGSLYLLAIASVRLFPLITPLGGLALMLGWFMLFIGALSMQAKAKGQ